jgi:hypothetical protein
MAAEMRGFRHSVLRETFNQCLVLTVLLITFSQLHLGIISEGYFTTQAIDLIWCLGQKDKGLQAKYQTGF